MWYQCQNVHSGPHRKFRRMFMIYKDCVHSEKWDLVSVEKGKVSP